jgi:hypothetical protein
MKPTQLNPFGNLFERLKAAAFLFRDPDGFVNGVLNAYERHVLEYAQAEYDRLRHAQTCGERENLPETTTISEQLTQAADRARGEAVNG